MGKRRRAERERHWQSVLDRHRTSGQSVRAFCQEHGICQASFYSWRRKLTPTGSGERGAPTATIESSSRSASPTPFIPLTIKGVMGSGHVIEVLHPRGHVVRIPAAFDSETLHRLFAVLDRGDA